MNRFHSDKLVKPTANADSVHLETSISHNELNDLLLGDRPTL